jgi:hypothetical protein
MTYARTPLPDRTKVNDLDSGSERWSIRSMPQGSPLSTSMYCVVSATTVWSCSMACTRGLLRSALSWTAVSRAANPFSAER